LSKRWGMILFSIIPTSVRIHQILPWFRLLFIRRRSNPMGEQLHKRFSTEIVQFYLERYLDKTIELSYLLDILGIKKRRFYQLLNRYRTDPEHFSLVFPKRRPSRTITSEVETNILNELTIERAMIEDPKLPIRTYNYSYIQDELSRKHSKKYPFPP
jgi:hypothetical protein